MVFVLHFLLGTQMERLTCVVPCVICPLNMSVGWGCTVAGREGEGKNYRDRALSSVMSPCLPGLLCAASLSLITGCDGIHQRMPTEWETIISLSVCLLVCQTDSQSICPFVHAFLYMCRISGWFDTDCYCGTQVVQGKVPDSHHKDSGFDSW